MAKVDQVTKEDLEQIIKNYESDGRDATEIKEFMDSVYPPRGKSTHTIPPGGSDEIDVDELKSKANKSSGECLICHKKVKTLYDGACDICFSDWMRSALVKK